MPYILIGLIVILLLVLFAGFEKMLDRLINLSPEVFTLTFVIFGLEYMARSHRWKHFVSSLGSEIAFREAAGLTLSSSLLNFFLPFRIGETVKLERLRSRHGMHTGDILISVATENFFDVCFLAIVTPFVIVTFISTKIGQSSLIIWLFCLSGILAVTAVIFSNQKFILIAERVPNPLGGYLKSIFLSIQFLKEYYSSNKARALWPIVLTLFIFLCESLFVHSLATYYFEDLPFHVSVAVVIVGLLTLTVPFLPGAVGSYELAISLLLTSVGLPLDEALVFVLTQRAILSIFLLFDTLFAYLIDHFS
ncbi:MAG: YbhN family protein [Candidatus Heimdallarchaeota archaeon]